MLLAAVAVVHLVALPEHAAEAPYFGLLFAADAGGAILAAIGVSAGSSKGWRLGAALAAASMTGYVLARTVGLPSFRESDWIDFLGPLPLGALSLVIEGLFLALYAIEEMAAPRGSGNSGRALHGN